MLTKLINEKIKKGIQDFHDYLNLGWSVDAARKEIIKHTVYKPVIAYVNNYHKAY